MPFFSRASLSRIGAAFAICAVASAPWSGPALAEPYSEYLDRLRYICEAECLQPRDFQRAARGNAREILRDEAPDMAVIMDVVDVVRVGDTFELHDMDLQGSPLEEQAVLGSAGINTSSSNGIGGLSRSGRSPRHPNLIVIQFDEDTLYDVFGFAAPAATDPQGDTKTQGDSELVVRADRDSEVVKPSLAALRSYFRNRRIVVRGTPSLDVVWYGGRRDYRRKQVTLRVNRAEDIVLLPRYDDDGEAIVHDGFGN